MQIDHIRAFNVALFVALISPEPFFLIVLRSGLHFGNPASLAVGMGRSLVAAFWTLAALASLMACSSCFHGPTARSKSLAHCI